MSLPLNQIIQGDCIEVLPGFPDNSIDLVVTDPPYGLGFMGKEWDKALPPREAFVEIIRVLKPGALAFVMSSPRQDVLWRMLSMLEGVGFELRQSHISWIYKTGFPKAMDISLEIDKKVIREEFKAEYDRYPSKDELKDLVKKKRKVIGINEEFRQRVRAEIKRGQQNINKNRQLLGLTNSQAGYQNPDQIGLITEPYSPDAKKWEGWKSQTGLKPALEMILMVNKPRSERTIIDNVLRWGTGAINVDACRIPLNNEKITAGTPNSIRKGTYNQHEGWQRPWKENDPEEYARRCEEAIERANRMGRFPANLLVSDKAIDTGKITKSGDLLLHHKLSKDEEGYMKRNIYGKLKRQTEHYYGDSGDQSRYFDLDVWAIGKGFCDTPKPSRSERGSDNTHPTVKPIKLMAYLIELGCPPKGVVLDPFLGSGTTCIAAKQLGRKYVGIELNEEYHALAVSRVAAYPQPLELFENIRKEGEQEDV